MFLEIISLLSISFFTQGCSQQNKTSTKLLKFNNKNISLMVPSNLGVTSALELQGTSICVNTETTTELIADFFNANNMNYELVPFKTLEEGRQKYKEGKCDAISTNSLDSLKNEMDNPDDHMILTGNI